MIKKDIDLHNWITERLKIDEERLSHSFGAEKAAIELAERFGCDESKAALAALIHDNAKCFSYKELLQIVKENNFPVEKDILDNHKILHASVGAFLAEKELGITDTKILSAITYHTTGKKDMTLLEKIVYLADKIEENTRPPEYRNPIVKILKEENDIDRAILLTINTTIKSLIDRKLVINALTIEVWNDLIIKYSK